ncbi:MAG TPA: lipid-A-disaccharide synthase [Candidatus Angelobacter sp.]|nr:lipid-A-disaccharide synthase [Candidatus Angelobacter sp.]
MAGRTFMLIAGEASGDLLAAELVNALKQSPELRAMPFPPEFFGAGGPKMAEAGVEQAVDLTRHSVIGLFDALKKYPVFRRIFDQLLQLALEREPDVIICVDFSGFNRRFAHAVKKHIRTRRGAFNNWDPRIVQYVSPQVWASRPGRAHQLARDCDLLLSIFPFEKEWYAAREPKVRVEFVGHPVIDRFQKSRVEDRKPEISATSPLVLLLPGSRTAEVRRHLPVLLDAAERIRSAKPEARFKIVWPNEELKRIGDRTCSSPVHLEIQVGGLERALTEATLAVAKSGTVVLECALFGVPAVVFYKASWPSYSLARMLVSINHLAMPNLLAGEEVFPEFIQHTATAANIADAALEILSHPLRQMTIRAKVALVNKALGEPGASGRAAGAVLSLLKKTVRPLHAASAG